MSENPKLIRAMKEGKAPFEYLVLDVLAEDAEVHATGGRKYGIFNWRRDHIKASTYKAAILRHFIAWFGGEDTDPESGKSHLAHIRACCAILRDSQMRGTLIDDRHYSESIDQDTGVKVSGDPNRFLPVGDAEKHDFGDEDFTTEFHIKPGQIDGLTPDGEVLDVKFGRKSLKLDGEIEQDGFTTIWPPVEPLALSKGALDRLLEDILPVGKYTTPGLEKFGQHRKDELRDLGAGPGWYVEFRDETPGECFAVWTAITGPFETEDEAREYAQRNPEKFAGTRSIFELK